MANIETIWYQQADEPTEWYERFVKFYLPGVIDAGGLNRAYIEYLKEQKNNNNSAAAKKLKNGETSITKEWTSIANKYNWRERAEAFKKNQIQRLLELEEKRVFNIIEMRLQLAEEAIQRQKVLSKQFQQNYGDPNLAFDKTADAVNIARMDSLLSESSEKAINQYTELTGLKSLLEDKQKEQNS